MNAPNEHIIQLWRSYLANEASHEEVKELFGQVSQAGDTEEHAEMLQQLLALVMVDKKLDAEVKEEMIRKALGMDAVTADLQSAADSILESPYSENKELSPAPTVHRVHFLRTAWFRYAAAVLLILGVSGYLFNNRNIDHTPSLTTVTPYSELHDIGPGGNKAILTLSDGRTIVLDTAVNGSLSTQGTTRVIKLQSGQLAYEAAAGVASQSGEVLYNTISTPVGGQYQIILADGSKVTLNAASSLRFPTAFRGDHRNVQLNGEAYFDVVYGKGNNKEAGQPFTVNTKSMIIDVLGTSFNVNAYDDEQVTKTTLIEGSVKVFMDKSGSGGDSYNGLERREGTGVILKPGQQVTTLPGNQISSVNTGIETAWVNGLFMFDNATIEPIMRQLARWYNLEVTYEQKIDNQFRATIPRNLPVSQVLKALESTKEVRFKIDGNKIIVTR